MRTERIDIRRYPQLRALCWNIHGASYLDADVAFGKYERNWHWIEQDSLTPRESALIQRLADKYGAGVINA